MMASLRSPSHLTIQVTPSAYRSPYTSPRSPATSHHIPWNYLVHCVKCRPQKILSSIPLRRALVAILAAFTAVLLLISVFYRGTSVLSGFSSDVLSWRLQATPHMTQELPQCIIVGVRKCGTRALLEFLSLHPQIRRSHEELHFFDRDERYRLGLDWYRRQMPQSEHGQITMEKTPAYFITREAPSRIHQMNDSIKLLFIVRDPVTRMISDYVQSYTHHQRLNLSYPSFEDQVMDPESGEISTSYKPTWISLYYLHWLNWQSTFNRSQMHIVDGELLITDPVSELKKVEAFLGIKSFVNKDKFFLDETRGFYCSENGCMKNNKGRAHPSVRPRVLHRLYRFFNTHNENFFKLTGQYFDWTEETRRKHKTTKFQQDISRT